MTFYWIMCHLNTTLVENGRANISMPILGVIMLIPSVYAAAYQQFNLIGAAFEECVTQESKYFDKQFFVCYNTSFA